MVDAETEPDKEIFDIDKFKADMQQKIDQQKEDIQNQDEQLKYISRTVVLGRKELQKQKDEHTKTRNMLEQMYSETNTLKKELVERKIRIFALKTRNENLTSLISEYKKKIK